jgi:hypothetical protein
MTERPRFYEAQSVPSCAIINQRSRSEGIYYTWGCYTQGLIWPSNSRSTVIRWPRDVFPAANTKRWSTRTPHDGGHGRHAHLPRSHPSIDPKSATHSRGQGEHDRTNLPMIWTERRPDHGRGGPAAEIEFWGQILRHPFMSATHWGHGQASGDPRRSSGRSSRLGRRWIARPATAGAFRNHGYTLTLTSGFNGVSRLILQRAKGRGQWGAGPWFDSHPTLHVVPSFPLCFPLSVWHVVTDGCAGARWCGV